jgi:hypothetical protein
MLTKAILLNDKQVGKIFSTCGSRLGAISLPIKGIGGDHLSQICDTSPSNVKIFRSKHFEG